MRSNILTITVAEAGVKAVFKSTPVSGWYFAVENTETGRRWEGRTPSTLTVDKGWSWIIIRNQDTIDGVTYRVSKIVIDGETIPPVAIERYWIHVEKDFKVTIYLEKIVRELRLTLSVPGFEYEPGKYIDTKYKWKEVRAYAWYTTGEKASDRLVTLTMNGYESQGYGEASIYLFHGEPDVGTYTVNASVDGLKETATLTIIEFFRVDAVTDKETYRLGETIHLTATLTGDGVRIPNASIYVYLLTPEQQYIVGEGSGVTDVNGTARVDVSIPLDGRAYIRPGIWKIWVQNISPGAEAWREIEVAG